MTHVCIDINECDTGDFVCGVNETCNNTFRSYECICSEGYHNQSGFCEGTASILLENWSSVLNVYAIDIDECSMDFCDSNAECENLQPGYACHCLEGYEHKTDEFLCEGTTMYTPLNSNMEIPPKYLIIRIWSGSKCHIVATRGLQES